VIQDRLLPPFQGIPPPYKLSIITQFKIKDDVIQYPGGFFFTFLLLEIPYPLLSPVEPLKTGLLIQKFVYPLPFLLTELLSLSCHNASCAACLVSLEWGRTNSLPSWRCVHNRSITSGGGEAPSKLSCHCSSYGVSPLVCTHYASITLPNHNKDTPYPLPQPSPLLPPLFILLDLLYSAIFKSSRILLPFPRLLAIGGKTSFHLFSSPWGSYHLATLPQNSL